MILCNSANSSPWIAAEQSLTLTDTLLGTSDSKLQRVIHWRYLLPPSRPTITVRDGFEIHSLEVKRQVAQPHCRPPQAR